MRKDLTDLTLVIDRSGSMQSCRADTEGGVNSYIEEQKKADGECVFTLVQFDDDYEFVYKGVPINDVGKYTLTPRGGTALLDAVGKAISQTGERLAAMDEADRPGLVVFVIVTDGGENSSKEFSRAAIKEMIERQQSEYSWQFTFLGANQDAFEAAGSIGILRSGVANYRTDDTSEAFSAVTSNTRRMRTAACNGLAVDNSYTDVELRSMNGGSNPSANLSAKAKVS